MKALLLLLPLASSAPLEILSYSAPEAPKGAHSHVMEGTPGESVSGEFSFSAPDTADTLYKVTYTADEGGFQPVADHLPVPVVMEEVPEVLLPQMVDYTPEVAAARASFLSHQEELAMKHAMEEEAMEMEEEAMEEEVETVERRRREASPVTIPKEALPYQAMAPTKLASLLPSYPSYLHGYQPYLTYPLALPQASPVVRQPLVRVPYPSYTSSFPSYTYPIYRVLPQVSAGMATMEGEDEPAALAL